MISQPDRDRAQRVMRATTEPVDYVVAAGAREALDEVETLRQELAALRGVEAKLGVAEAEIEALKAERDRNYALIQTARQAARRITAVLIANANRLDVPFTNYPGSPWTVYISPAISQLRAGLGMRGAWPVGCTCQIHGRNCEPPSELCCENCSESQHPSHVDGSACSAPDLSGYQMPTETELALRTEVIRLTDDQAAMLPVVEAAKAWFASIDMTRTPTEGDLGLALLALALSTKDDGAV